MLTLQTMRQNDIDYLYVSKVDQCSNSVSFGSSFLQLQHCKRSQTLNGISQVLDPDSSFSLKIIGCSCTGSCHGVKRIRRIES